MKLCRFELKNEPGTVRSGMVYSGKVYETDGAQAIGVHEAEAIRPLAPVGHVNSIRLFRTDLFPESHGADEYAFFYGNPGSLYGPSQLIPYPALVGELSFEPYIAAVIVENGLDLDLAQSDDIVLGVTILNVLVAKNWERRQGGPGGRTHDIGLTIGPVITTPDELDEAIVESENGRRYGLGTLVRVNGVEVASDNLEMLPLSLAQAIAFASQSCTLIAGDVIAVGPIVDSSSLPTLQPGDEIHISVERLGMLSVKIAPDATDE